ncbi:MAG TPA: histidine kinase [Longimicrobiaceae bacterium]|jgi:signal transduction histidine kinase|nr:histidine kinase [Longimicrobiaceae bacterium]
MQQVENRSVGVSTRRAGGQFPRRGITMGRRKQWLLAFAIATVLVLLIGTQNYLAFKVQHALFSKAGLPSPPVLSWLVAVGTEIPAWYPWVLFSPAIFALARRFSPLGPRPAASVVVHCAAACVGTALMLMVATAVQRAFGLPAGPRPLGYWAEVALGTVRVLGGIITIYAMMLAIHEAAAYHDAYQRRSVRSAQLEAQLSTAQLDSLRSQLQPHFLFNTLNTITALMFKDPHAAQQMMVRLSDLLRASLEDPSTHEVTLREEVAFAVKYLEIQTVRFQDRLRVEWSLDPDTLDLLVPRHLLQPLVENSVRYGVEQTSRPGVIEVRSARAGGTVRISVRDDGAGTAEANPLAGGTGIGLDNTRARLRHLYGDGHEFRADAGPAGGFEVTIGFPARTQSVPEH